MSNNRVLDIGECKLKDLLIHQAIYLEHDWLNGLHVRVRKLPNNKLLYEYDKDGKIYYSQLVENDK